MTGAEIEAIFYAIFICMCWSWLYKGDNPLYRISQNITLGLAFSIGFKASLDTIITKASPIMTGDIYALIFTVLGLMTLLRFNRSTLEISYWPLAIVAGVGTAIGVKGSVGPMILRQTIGAPWYGTDMLSNINNIMIWVAVTSLIIYFIFTVKRDAFGGTVGKVASIGFFFMVIAFGASVGSGFLGSFTMATGLAVYLFTYPGYFITAIAAIVIIVDVYRESKKQ